jgi:dihydrofolate reductase
MIAVSTLDGLITKHKQPGATTWASPEDQAHFRSATAACDVRIFGASTYRADRAWMRSALRPGIVRVVLTRNPESFADDVVAGQLEFTSEDPKVLVARLAAQGCTRLALLGGGEVYGAFLAADLVDEIQLTVEPLFFGTGVRLTGGTVPIDARFSLHDVTRLNESTLLVTYHRK